MSRIFLLDTNTVIYILRGRSPAARAKLATLPTDEIAAVSIITEGELLYGIEKSSKGDQRRRALELSLSGVQVLPWERVDAAAYGRLGAK